MKLPRNVDATRLITAFRRLGYVPTRQTGSHIRLTFDGPPAHSVTIPNHSPIKLGTLNAIPADIAVHRHIEKSASVDALFG